MSLSFAFEKSRFSCDGEESLLNGGNLYQILYY